MQVLYQVDLRGEDDLEAIRQNVEQDEHKGPETGAAACNLAAAAWARRGEADAIIARLAPDWPTHRQPPVDRAILRLAYYEMISEHAPIKVAINEAVELAKDFGAEHSFAFINGVLDKMARTMGSDEATERRSDEGGGEGRHEGTEARRHEAAEEGHEAESERPRPGI